MCEFYIFKNDLLLYVKNIYLIKIEIDFLFLSFTF